MRTILVTGVSSGLGRQIAEDCLAAGDRVIGLARQAGRLSHQAYQPLSIDFSDPKACEQAFKTLVHDMPDVDAIISAAGMGQFSGLESFSLTQIQNLMQVNVLAHMQLIKAYMPSLKARGASKVILIGSESALQGAKQGSVYCASKFALRGFSQSIRHELAKYHVPVTLINPGLCRTDFFQDCHFQPGSEPEHAIAPAVISQTVQYVLALPNTLVVEEINLQPLHKVVVKS